MNYDDPKVKLFLVELDALCKKHDLVLTESEWTNVELAQPGEGHSGLDPASYAYDGRACQMSEHKCNRYCPGWVS